MGAATSFVRTGEEERHRGERSKRTRYDKPEALPLRISGIAGRVEETDAHLKMRCAQQAPKNRRADLWMTWRKLSPFVGTGGPERCYLLA